MTTLEKKLAAKMLDISSDEFGNHGCNDVDDAMFEGWELWERQDFCRRYHEWNGDPEEYDPNFLHIPDYAIMSFLSHILTESA